MHPKVEPLYADALYLPIPNKKLRQKHQQMKQAAT